MSDDINSLVERLGERLKSRGLYLATAESCTGGLIGHLLTGVSGSSEWYRGGVTAYADEVKQKLLSVPGSALEDQGAVSESVVRFMARGAREALNTQVGVSVSGVAGPTGGTPDKPVGTVWIGWDTGEELDSEVFHFDGPREAVKAQSARAAIEGLLERLD
jgi:nicotinamide-nucleotide amidase